MMKKQFHKVVSKFTIVFLIIGMLVGGCKEKETSKVAVRLPSFPAIKSSIQKIACVGDSITYGSTLQDRKSESYPSQLSKRFGNTIQVKNNCTYCIHRIPPCKLIDYVSFFKITKIRTAF